MEIDPTAARELDEISSKIWAGVEAGTMTEQQAREAILAYKIGRGIIALSNNGSEPNDDQRGVYEPGKL